MLKEKDQNFKNQRKRYGAKDYLNTFDLEKLNFLNDSQKLMQSGSSFANHPGNSEAAMNIMLYDSLKEKMNSDQHRKLQHLIRFGKDDLKDKEPVTEA